MTTTIIQGFDKLRQNLEITELQSSTVSSRQSRVRNVVETSLRVHDSFLIGSYSRNTMIAPLSEADIDVFIVLYAEDYRSDGQAWLLDRLRAVLRVTYPTTSDISRNGQAVTITFSDFKVDVVPAFCRQGGGFLIPDTIQKRWISTDPKKHIEIWAAANSAHDGKLVPLIKMLKCWNREHSHLLHSFHLEALILNILSGVTISDYPSGVRYVFDKARTLVRYPITDPAGYGANIGGYLSTQSRLDAVVSRLETACQRATEAESLARSGRVPEAYGKWQLLFGDRWFPAYG